ncbi:MAG: hypothetical protein DDG58_07880 [Ardenticatenia bacterium]|nr:MAG: hypothetical protein DDG58_07880 [Ardenticatenia bacterium]
MQGGWLNYLSDNDLERIHLAALALLEDPGIFSDSEVILEIFERGDAWVDRESRTIRLPAELVGNALKTAPSTLCAAWS